MFITVLNWRLSNCTGKSGQFIQELTAWSFFGSKGDILMLDNMLAAHGRNLMKVKAQNCRDDGRMLLLRGDGWLLL